MPEDDNNSNCDEDETETEKRQVGDGNDSKQTSGKGSSTGVAAVNEEQETEKELIKPTANEDVVEPVVVKDCSEEPVESLSCSGRSSASVMSPSPARAGLSSQRDLLRQQFRLLHSQELIRRILQSSGALPNNLAQNTSSQLRSTGKTSEKREEDLTKSKDPLPISSVEKLSAERSVKTSEEAETKDQRPTEFCANSLESVKPRNDQENKQEKTCKEEMESDTSFVCSVCSCKQEEHTDRKDKQTDELLNTSEESCLSSVVSKPEDTIATVDLNASSPSKVPSTVNPNVEELSQRLHKQPSHEMLDEILRLLQNQAKAHPLDGVKDENQNTIKRVVKKPLETMQQAKPLESFVLDESLNDEEWKQQQHQKFLMMQTRPNLREKHSRQLADMKNYYESELGKLRDQLDSLRGNLSNLQEAIPMKMLEAANQKLEARCRLMEEIANELKGKCQKLEQMNEELERSCVDLRQTNEALEMKCNFLQQSVHDTDGKQSELLNKNKILESKILHLTQVNEVNSKNCKQLKESNKTFETACKQLEESNEKLEVRYRMNKEENLKLSVDMRDLQGSLQTSRKHAQEKEKMVASLQNEKSDWILKLDLAQKMVKGAQKRYEEVKIERNEKESIAKMLEEQMGVLTLSCEHAAKAKAELEQNAERDRELLKRLLIEYDALVKENQKLKESIGSISNKFDISQDERNDLRGTISTLVFQNNNLEESLKEALSHSAKSTPDSFVSGPRKAWDSPVPLKSGEAHHTSHPSLSSFDSVFGGRDKFMSSSPVKDDQSRVTDVETPQKDQSNTPPSVKFEIAWEKAKSHPSTPNRNTAKRNLEKSYSSEKPSNIKSPNNLVVKKSDLVTRFDVVFADSVSGTEVKRSHTGRTSRAQGESPTSIFVSNSVTDVTGSSPSNHMVSNAAEAALNALKSGRVVSQADWEGRDTKRVMGRRDKSSERKKMRQPQSANADNTERDDRENDVVPKLERKFSSLTEERKRLESTLSRIPTHRVTKRSKDDKAFLENRLDEVLQDIGSVRMQLRHHHAL